MQCSRYVLSRSATSGIRVASATMSRRQRHPPTRPVTLGDLMRERVAVLCWCNRCSHHASLAAAALAARLGEDAAVPGLAARLVCGACGSANVATRPDWPTQHAVARAATAENMPRNKLK